MKIYTLNTPLTNEDVLQLKVGDKVFLSGKVFTARDAAHKRIIEALDMGQQLPFSLEGAVIYYVIMLVPLQHLRANP